MLANLTIILNGNMGICHGEHSAGNGTPREVDDDKEREIRWRNIPGKSREDSKWWP